MAYYNNPYLGYLPYMQQLPAVYPQQLIDPQQMLPNAQNGQTSSDSYMIWVQGKAGAQSYPVARGTTLPLFDSEADYLYIKSVDNNGIPLPLVTKVLSDPPVEVKAEVIETPVQVDMSDYVTREKYEELHKKYSELEHRILELETKPSLGFTSTFTGNTFNNSRKGNDDGNK